MNETATRIEQIIQEHFDYIEHEFELWDEDEFEDNLGEELQARYGWTIPQIGGFCIERLTRQTIHLNEEDLVDYLRAILWMCDRHVILAYERPDLNELERHHEIESQLYDIAPNSMALMSEVEIHALEM